jgi:aminoglycoside phosphotransferase (APT) family kinase protein
MDARAIDPELARRLVASQFPQWAGLPVRPVGAGWDNRTFRLGEDLLARLPSAARYVAQVKKEQAWLPRLAPGLPLPIPKPVAMGRPGQGYPWPWSVYRWIEGETVLAAPPADAVALARDLAGFLAALQRLDTDGGPAPGPHNVLRGAPLPAYDAETRSALGVLGDRIDVSAATALWDAALASAWSRPPVWLHGDVAPWNLLARDGRLAAVLDWGLCGVGDPACDLAIAWTWFAGDARAAFRAGVPVDAPTWTRARGWVLWKAAILMAGFSGDHPDVPRAPHVLAEVLAE